MSFNKLYLWEIINSNIISGLVLLLLSIFISVWIIDFFRMRSKRKTLLSLVAREMGNIPELKNIDSRYFRMSISDYFYKELLSSDAFNYRKDKKLLVILHELCSLIDMFNSLCEAGNQALLSDSNVNSDQLVRGSNLLLKEIIENKETIMSIINNEYKVNAFEIP